MSEVQGTEESVELTLEELLQPITEESVQEPVTEEPLAAPEPEETPIRPVFTGNEEAEDTVTEEELDAFATEIEEAFAESESEKTELEKTISELSETLAKVEAEKAEALELAQSRDEEVKTVEDAWAKVREVPILGKLVQDVLEGKEVDIPKMLEKSVSEDLESMPNIDASSQVSVKEAPKGLQDVFNNTPTIRFN